MTTSFMLFRSPSVGLGRFRCPPDDGSWRGENWIGPEHHVVFPQRPVVIEQAHRKPVVANPNHVVLYDRSQLYRRRRLATDGDVALFVVVAPAVVRDIVGRDRGGPADATFPAPCGPLGERALLRIQLLARALELRPSIALADPLAVEEALLEILDEAVRPAVRLAAAGPPAGRPGRRRTATIEAHRELVEDTKSVISVGFAERRSIEELGRAVGSSPFHLARVFRAATGLSLHAYRDQLRLRHAIERLAGGETNLGRLAIDLGFASHAHFDDRFRSVFGTRPSSVRAAGRLRTFMEVGPGRPV